MGMGRRRKHNKHLPNRLFLNTDASITFTRIDEHTFQRAMPKPFKQFRDQVAQWNDISHLNARAGS